MELPSFDSSISEPDVIALWELESDSDHFFSADSSSLEEELDSEDVDEVSS